MEMNFKFLTINASLISSYSKQDEANSAHKVIYSSNFSQLFDIKMKKLKDLHFMMQEILYANQSESQ